MVPVGDVINAATNELQRRAPMIEQDDVRTIILRVNVTERGKIDLVATQVETRAVQDGHRRRRT